MTEIEFFDDAFRPVVPPTRSPLVAFLESLDPKDFPLLSSSETPAEKEIREKQRLLGQMLSWLGRAQSELDGLAEVIDMVLSGTIKLMPVAAPPLDETQSRSMQSSEEIIRLMNNRCSQVKRNISLDLAQSDALIKAIEQLQLEGARLLSVDARQGSIIVNVGKAGQSSPVPLKITKSGDLVPAVGIPRRFLSISCVESHVPSVEDYCKTWQEVQQVFTDGFLWQHLVQRCTLEEIRVCSVVRPDRVIELTSLKGPQKLFISLTHKQKDIDAVKKISKEFEESGKCIDDSWNEVLQEFELLSK